VSFLALPRSTVFVIVVTSFDLFKAPRADKTLVAGVVSADAIENFIDSSTSLACFDANSFDSHFSCPFDYGNGIVQL
jgi:hypothetical protein